MISQFSFPTPITFGPGARTKIPEILNDAGAKRPLVVTDRDLAKLEPVKWIEELIANAGLATTTYSGIWGNPVKTQVEKGVEAYREHKADSIVIIGGGASLDVGKVIGLMVNHPGDLFDYDACSDDCAPIDKELPFILAVPTTAGTGSEVGRASLVSDDETHKKVIFFHQKLLPKAVIGDPELTIGLPAKVTATTGMDALTHLTEAYIARGFHPICDGIALEGISYVSKSLVSCVEYAKAPDRNDADQVRARGDMLIAAMMGALAFQKGLGITHSCANALTTYYPELHHGLANGILIPYVMEYNETAVPGRFTTMAKAVGLKGDKAGDYVGWLRALKAKIGVPEFLSEVGVGKDRIKDLVEHAMTDLCNDENPRQPNAEDFEMIFTKAIGGA